mmetsp:Transcript_1838/g.2788  ORF Transcript_1838/g.2788 Transcript_1838/m.2788 type:complete len:148 (+) Transcript_1838:37-480(+)|eukprot:CAMPEP_0195517224 /NCGR_PEP_ID=MMETSP0794_2-20130614/10248_1 /TAXON_ID=515487 /ORGANISM="Stephanopyxis turris, Strain CCMP 815" /LENGTH=147 /DNA_ID=CAMNT_0040645997 /DNA_START=37 /DNA_END=480 /DNA_ORIENTATION=+
MQQLAITLAGILLITASSFSNGFVTPASLVTKQRRTSLSMLVQPDMPSPPPTAQQVPQGLTFTSVSNAYPTSTSTSLNDNIVSWNIKESGNSVTDSSMSVSLQEIKKKTKEEIDKQNRDLAFWFWGGGFVAPFIATVYYFGPKFWLR